MSTTPKQYPAVRYHATEKERVVRSVEEEADLGPGWFDSPKKAKAGASKADARQPRASRESRE